MKTLIPVALFLLLSFVSSAKGALEWKLIFRQTVPYYYKKGNTLLHNSGDPGAPNYSILGDFAKFKHNGKFTLKLKWPGLGTENVWSQTSNPIIPGTVTLYKSINTPYTGCYWNGLQYSNGPTFLKGSTNAWWFYAVASFSKWSTGIPGPCTGTGGSSKGIAVQEVELYVQVEAGVGNPIPDGVTPRSGCTCSDQKQQNHLGGNIGACLTTLKGKHWCYLVDNQGSKCPDKKKSSRPGNLWWGYEACKWYTEFEPNTGK